MSGGETLRSAQGDSQERAFLICQGKMEKPWGVSGRSGVVNAGLSLVTAKRERSEESHVGQSETLRYRSA